jgi:membrane protein implicated in regulation of membrane protease activity
MVVLGLLLLLVAAFVVAAFFVGGVRQALVDAGVDRLLTDPPPQVAFALGALAAVLVLVGLWLVSAGLRRRVRKRRLAKERTESARTEASTLAEENARLQGRLHSEQTRDVSPYPGSEPAGPTPAGDAAR